ncbi:MAG: HEPN domain-containing protein [Corynebacterium glutamicum]|nr:HEPN domain-containing protein [Corynebacterium glutamicum]
MTNIPEGSPSLFRPDLWDLLLPGILAARRVGREYVNSGKYYPRQTSVEYREQNSGWPQTVRSYLDIFPTGPVNWKALFDLEKGEHTQIAVEEVPELAKMLHSIVALGEYDDDVAHVISLVAPYLKPGEDRNRSIKHETLLFIGQILNRADAIGAEEVNQLRTIYQCLEYVRLSKNLKGDIVVPLVAVAFDTQEPIKIRDNIWLEPLSISDHRSRALSHDPNSSANAFVAAAATHAVTIRDVKFSNNIFPYNLRQSIPQEFDLSIVDHVITAVRLLAVTKTGYAQILVRPQGWAVDWIDNLPSIWIAWSGRSYPESLNAREWINTFKPIEKNTVHDIIRFACELETAPKGVQLSARRYSRITFRTDREDQILDAAIGIEALLGKEPDAITHRLAQRAAVALTQPFTTIPISPSEIYSLVKQFYSARSQIAHGSEARKLVCKIDDREYSVESVGQFLLGELLKARLLGDDPWNAESLDAQLLNSLAMDHRGGGIES